MSSVRAFKAWCDVVLSSYRNVIRMFSKRQLVERKLHFLSVVLSYNVVNSRALEFKDFIA